MAVLSALGTRLQRCRRFPVVGRRDRRELGRAWRATARAWHRSDRAGMAQRLSQLCGAGALVWTITSSSPERARVEMLRGETLELLDPSRGLFRLVSLAGCDGLFFEGVRRVPGTSAYLVRFRSFHGALLRLLAEVELGREDPGGGQVPGTTGRASPGPASEDHSGPRRSPGGHKGGR